MNKRTDDPAFLFYPGDYLRDTQCMSENAQVAYDRIMCEHMRNICISQQQLNFFTKKLTEDEKTEVMFVLEQVDGGFRIPWVFRSISKRREYSESRAKNRAGKKKNTSITYVPHMENENENENENINTKESIGKIDFIDFWNQYGYKEGNKKGAKKIWDKLSLTTQEKIIKGLPAFVEREKIRCADPSARRLHASTFLNQERYLTESYTSDVQSHQVKKMVY